MRVRVRFGKTGDMRDRWFIDVKRWWWPWWVTVDYWDSEEVAIAKAQAIKYPKIIEVGRMK